MMEFIIPADNRINQYSNESFTLREGYFYTFFEWDQEKSIVNPQ